MMNELAKAHSLSADEYMQYPCDLGNVPRDQIAGDRADQGG